MKNLLFLFLTSFTTIPILAQNAENIRVIPSLTDWIEEINTWPDSVYEVENIKVLIDMDKDSLIAHYHVERLNLTSENEEIAAVVKKPIRINHWFIQTDFGTNDLKTIKNIRFKEEVELRDKQSYGIGLDNVIFEKELMFNGQERFSWFNFKNCQFNQNVTFANFNDFAQITFEDCELEEALYTFQIPGAPILRILNTKIKLTIDLGSAELKRLWINKSEINTILLENAEINTALYIVDSDIKNIEIEGASLPAFNTYIPFDQVKGKLCISTWANSEYEYYRAEKDKDFDAQDKYDYLIASYKLLLNGYQNRGDQDSYNSCYVEMKNIETRRLAYLHRKNPSFTSYFSWKINQFLKVFSEYGTRPARAIVFSLYVILFFALIYLFFPNSWDHHGRNRIIHRYKFFFKYLNRNAGIHEVYLEEKQEEMLTYDQFKTEIEKAEMKVPRFFTWSAYPLYKWAISGTRVSAGILKRFDILQGTWTDLPEERKWWKGILLTGAFIIALIYDLIIKMLNALMLSINTFTTLGFGEIPIKGLPRYLAIIQGFIGWFMLTIFSVSLISQLLN